MESQIERISPVECRIRVEVPWKEVAVRFDRKLEDLGRQSRIPGFRPGKVPPRIVERMFGRQVREEVSSDIVTETFDNAVGKHSHRPLTSPVVESSEFEKGSPFVYSARFEVAPEIVPVDYKGVEVRRRPAVVAEGAVDAAIEAKRQQLAEIRPIPEDSGRENSREADIWTLDVEGSFGEQTVSLKDAKVEIGNSDTEFLPGVGKQLAALPLSAVGSTHKLEFEPDQDRLKPEFRGLKASLELGLREVREKVLPELDDEFAKDTGDAQSLEELRNKINEDLLGEDQLEAEREARRRLVDELMKRNPVEPAPSMVAREVEARVEAFQQQMRSQGLDASALGLNPREIGERLRPEARDNVSAFLLLDAVGKAEKIEVSEAELDSKVEELAEEQGQNVQRYRAQLERSQDLLLLRAQLREEKILDMLMDSAVVTEAPDPEPEPEADEAAETESADADASASDDDK